SRMRESRDATRYSRPKSSMITQSCVTSLNSPRTLRIFSSLIIDQCAPLHRAKPLRIREQPPFRESAPTDCRLGCEDSTSYLSHSPSRLPTCCPERDSV